VIRAWAEPGLRRRSGKFARKARVFHRVERAENFQLTPSEKVAVFMYCSLD
jgi:hypothetical protein